MLNRLAVAKSAVLREIMPGSHVYLAERSENALYIIVSGIAAMEVGRDCTTCILLGATG